jgi:hypothetical protein
MNAATIEAFEREAGHIANKVVPEFYAPTKDEKARVWNCAFHHALDLLLYARKVRNTVRCGINYRPNAIEVETEKHLRNRNIERGMYE